MGIPNVSFELLKGQLGGTINLDDGIAGLIVSGTATPDIALSEPKVIFSYEDALDLELSGFALREIQEFYQFAGAGQELWIMLVADDTLISEICDITNPLAKKLLDASAGRIKVWGVNVELTSSYSPSIPSAEGIDADVLAALPLAQALCEDFAGRHHPTRCVMGGRMFDAGKIAELRDLKQGSDNRVQITLLGRSLEELDSDPTNHEGKEARVGFLLGLYSSLSVQRNIGRVANGDLGLTEAFYSDGETTAEELMNAADTIHDKGYVLPIVRYGKNGYFYADDPTATADTDDFNSFARGRVIDKAQRIAYNVFCDFVNDDYSVDASGQIGIGELKRLQGGIDDAVNQQMTAAGEISAFQSFVDPAQDTLATGQTKVKLMVQPRAYHKQIVIELGFSKTIE
ncbi:DUF2586 family protein [Persicobacter sp. CCB-QB2]|uniref:DUF2586 family protein n=1 Tax=Persicobacter sp. CCB-QB2 TaxID=1561025 RepID=UPI0006A9E1B6|nr:DUF2586 family protein [Persicobacter sp. CCB-QB2]